MTSIQQYGKAAANRLASATVNGLLAAADYAKLQLLKWTGNKLLLPPNYTSYVADDTGGDIHLHAGSRYAFLEAATNAHMSGNAYWDGTNWMRYRTAEPAYAFWIDQGAGVLVMQYAPSGANPISWTTIRTDLTDTANRFITKSPGNDYMVCAAGAFYGMSNAYLDGTNWMRYNTAAGGGVLQVTSSGAGTGQVNFLPFIAGANPITFVGSYPIWNVQTSADANGWTLVDWTSGGKRRWQKRITVNSGWPAATAWAPIFSSNLPVGIGNLSQVRVLWSFFASIWSRVMQFGYDATTASTSIVMNGTLGAGPGNWNAINPVLVFDLECVEI